MYHKVADLLVVSPSTTLYTQAVAMDGDDILSLEAVLVTTTASLGTNDLKLSMERCDALINWQSLSANLVTFGGTVPAAKDGVITTSIPNNYVRVKIENASGTATVVLSASVNTKKS